jgi:hypothetical protein
MQVTLLQYGGKFWKSQVFLSGTNILKRAGISKSQMKKFSSLFRYHGYSSLSSHRKIFNRPFEALCTQMPELWPNDWISAMTVLQRSLFSGQKIGIEMDPPPPFPRFGSKWLLTVSKNKVCNKGTKISGYWRHPNKKKKNVTISLKAVPEQEFQNISNSVNVVGLGIATHW